MEAHPHRVGAVVLAAGRSSRMGGGNKLLELVGGVPVVARVVDALLAAGVRPVVVVTGHEAAAVEAALGERPIEAVGNPRWPEGMGTSLAAGVAALGGRVDGALICPGDMPRVGPADLAALLRAFRPAGGVRAWVPVHGGRRGNPVLWSSGAFPALARLGGDRGGKALLGGPETVVAEVPVPGEGVLEDVDTVEALDRVRRAWAPR